MTAVMAVGPSGNPVDGASPIAKNKPSTRLPRTPSSLTKALSLRSILDKARTPLGGAAQEGPMTVLLFVVGAFIGIPLATFAIIHFHARHHDRVGGTTMWHG